VLLASSSAQKAMSSGWPISRSVAPPSDWAIAASRSGKLARSRTAATARVGQDGRFAVVAKDLRDPADDDAGRHRILDDEPAEPPGTDHLDAAIRPRRTRQANRRGRDGARVPQAPDEDRVRGPEATQHRGAVRRAENQAPPAQPGPGELARRVIEVEAGRLSSEALARDQAAGQAAQPARRADVTREEEVGAAEVQHRRDRRARADLVDDDEDPAGGDPCGLRDEGDVDLHVGIFLGSKAPRASRSAGIRTPTGAEPLGRLGRSAS
jgi:hypothetical protein